MLVCFEEASPMGAVESTQQAVAPQNIAREQQQGRLYSYLNTMQEVGSARLDAQDRAILAMHESIRSLKHESVVTRETLDEVHAIVERLEKIALAQEAMARAFRTAMSADEPPYAKQTPPPTTAAPGPPRGPRRKPTPRDVI